MLICHSVCFGYYHRRARAVHGSGTQGWTLQLNQVSSAKKSRQECALAAAHQHCGCRLLITLPILQGAAARFALVASDSSRFLRSDPRPGETCDAESRFQWCSLQIIILTIFWKRQRCMPSPAATNCFPFENVLATNSPSIREENRGSVYPTGSLTQATHSGLTGV